MRDFRIYSLNFRIAAYCDIRPRECFKKISKLLRDFKLTRKGWVRPETLLAVAIAYHRNIQKCKSCKQSFSMTNLCAVTGASKANIARYLRTWGRRM